MYNNAPGPICLIFFQQYGQQMGTVNKIKNLNIYIYKWHHLQNNP